MKTKKKRSTSWKNEFYFRAYEYARSGKSDEQIAKLLGLSRPTFRSYKKRRPTLRKALEEARAIASDTSGEDLRRYIYERLPESLQELWDDINRIEEEPNGIQRIEMMLENKGIRARQHLFIHALVHYAFNPSEACRKVNITLSDLKHWINDDPDFAALVDEVHEHKKNFYVQCLNLRCRAGDTAAIIFANKTINRDLGYGEHTEHHHTGELETKQTFTIKELSTLPLQTRLDLLRAIRDKENAENIIHAPHTPAIAAK